MRVRVATYNPKDYWRRLRIRQEAKRYGLVDRIITEEIKPDILALQEMPGTTSLPMMHLASVAGMQCTMPGVPCTFAPGQHANLALGCLWTPHLQPIPGSWQVYGDGFWHGLVSLSFDIAGHEVTFFNYHGPPGIYRDPHEVLDDRRHEAVRIADIVGRHQFAVLSGDMNVLSAARVTGGFYDPEPVPASSPPPSEGATLYDRSIAQIFIDAGLHDTAVLARQPWAPTTGHWPDETNGYRRQDWHLCTPALAGCVVESEVIDSENARQASDHLAAVVTLDLAAA